MDIFLRFVAELYASAFTNHMLVFILLMGRTVPMITLTPWLGSKLAPPEIRIALGILFSILVYPYAFAAMDKNFDLTVALFVLLMLKESLIGFAIGFVSAHIYYALEIAGRIVDTGRGASMSEVMVPQSGLRATPFGDLFYQLMIVMFMFFGGHYIFLEMYFMSFGSIPLHAGISMTAMGGPFVDMMIKMTSEILLIGVVLSAPALAATFISDLVFGILNRVAPQLNAYFLSMPVKAIAGCIMVFLALTPFIDRMEEFTEWSLVQVEKTIDGVEVKK